MRIAIIAKLLAPISSSSLGGQESFIYYLSKELVRRNHHITVFASGDSEIENVKIFPTIKESPWSKARRLSPEKQKVIYRNTTEQSDGYIKILLYLKENEKDFDIVHDNACDSLTLLMGNLIQTPVVTTLHVPTAQFRSVVLDQKNKKNYFVAISKRQKFLSKNIKASDVNYNGTDEKKFEFSPTDNGYLAWIGRISPEKGLEKAIEISDRTNIPLKFGGTIMNKKYFMSKIEPKIKKAKNVKFLGKLAHQELVHFYQNAKVLLFPIDWEEPFGLVMIEAMSCGTPIIAFKKGSVPEIILGGKTGFICRPKDVDSMIQVVKKIYKMSPDRYQKMRLDCRKHVENKFTIEKMVDGYEKIYRKVIAKNKSKNK
ncbi:MAG: Glycosyl transferase group 1 [Berkelbacteria bacterium GW2011_GWA1_36_9]|uniref:Glycosyl transferase group 1 n=1 Tax=Berkelbacteria bacterium GW2011_GWA1_36_9 TaxID=1618331 RepID=A0A0G0FVR0_9BACT|nr:MAG: Glycosyl transferase group 1 [Berkelbacteria bacterium GW2011_GWA1_36_9]